MTHYELLCVFPGTMTVEEVQTAMNDVKETITKHGGEIEKVHSMGKSRLAYPMKHIRYGYFELVYFQAEGPKLAEIDRRVRLLGASLRTIFRAYDPVSQPIDTSSFNFGQVSHMQREEVATSPYRGAPRPKKEVTPKPVAETKTQAEDAEKATKEVSLEQIDEKLDEILEKDLAKV